MTVGNMMILKNEKGASSVLVILMMIVLVVFGLSALSSSLAGIRLSDRSFAWSEEYYVLESQAEKTLFEIDRILAKAEEDAINRTIRVYESDRNRYSSGYLEEDFRINFLKSAVQGLEKLEDRGLIEMSGQNTNEILVFATFSEDEKSNSKNIDMGIKVEPPEYEFDTTGEELSGTRVTPGGKRYTVTSWKEWQKPFEYEGDMDFTDI